MIALDNWTLDDHGWFTGPDGAVHLSRSEVRLLIALADRAGAVVSHERLLDVLWGGRNDGPTPKTLDVMIHRLRHKIASVGLPKLIRNIWGEGYVLAAIGLRPGVVLTLSPAQLVTFARMVRIAERESPGIGAELGVDVWGGVR